MYIAEHSIAEGASVEGDLMGWSPHGDALFHGAMLVGTCTDELDEEDHFGVSVTSPVDDGQVVLKDIPQEELQASRYNDVSSNWTKHLPARSMVPVTKDCYFCSLELRSCPSDARTSQWKDVCRVYAHHLQCSLQNHRTSSRI